MTTDEIADRVYVGWSDPTNIRSPRTWWADTNPAGDELAGPFATEAEAIAAVEATCA
jgi:hypothetical protein